MVAVNSSLPGRPRSTEKGKYVQSKLKQSKLKQSKSKVSTPVDELKERVSGLFGQGKRRYRVSGEDLTLFTRQLATMLGSGIPLHQALTYYGEASEGDLPEIIRKVAHDVASGHTFSNAMLRFPSVFSSIYIALAMMGEESGQIVTAYRRLADLLERQTNMKKKVISAITYPAILFLVSCLAIAGFIYFVLPMMTPMFENTGMDLPLPTRILLSLRTVVPLATVLMFVALIGGWLAIPWINRYLKANPETHRLIHSIPFHIPVVSGIYTKLSTARVLYAMSTMLDAGLTMTATIKRAAGAAGNELMAYRLKQANERIMEGASLGEALGVYNVFPNGAVQMLSVGEESANLSEMVKHVANLYDSEVELALNDIASVLEPIIMIFMGLIVGFIVLAAIMPTIQLIQSF